MSTSGLGMYSLSFYISSTDRKTEKHRLHRTQSHHHLPAHLLKQALRAQFTEAAGKQLQVFVVRPESGSMESSVCSQENNNGRALLTKPWPILDYTSDYTFGSPVTSGLVLKRSSSRASVTTNSCSGSLMAWAQKAMSRGVSVAAKPRRDLNY